MNFNDKQKYKRVQKTKIIAEVGPNHNGSLKLAYKLVDIAKDCGADYVKFQTSIPNDQISKFAKKAKYQIINTKNKSSQLKMANKLTLSYSDFIKLNSYCLRKKIKFLSTPFGLKSISFLKKFKMDYFKIPSGEITNIFYLTKVGKLNKKIIMSTGMANMKEIGEALKILIKNGTLKKNITVLHCNTEYPTPLKDANLRAMLSIKRKFKIQVGYSDHTTGIESAVAAVALGASIIEKHITINKKMRGPDHKASIEKNELKKMIEMIRGVEVALGNGIKRPSQSEKKNINIARNSIVASKKIIKGERFSYKNLNIKRPGNGISPMKIKKIIGKAAKKNFDFDELITL